MAIVARARKLGMPASDAAHLLIMRAVIRWAQVEGNLNSNPNPNPNPHPNPTPNPNPRYAADTGGARQGYDAPGVVSPQYHSNVYPTYPDLHHLR